MSQHAPPARRVLACSVDSDSLSQFVCELSLTLSMLHPPAFAAALSLNSLGDLAAWRFSCLLVSLLGLQVGGAAVSPRGGGGLCGAAPSAPRADLLHAQPAGRGVMRSAAPAGLRVGDELPGRLL